MHRKPVGVSLRNSYSALIRSTLLNTFKSLFEISSACRPKPKLTETVNAMVWPVAHIWCCQKDLGEWFNSTYYTAEHCVVSPGQFPSGRYSRPYLDYYSQHARDKKNVCSDDYDRTMVGGC